MAENADGPAHLEQQDVAMRTAVSGESTSVKRGAVAGAGLRSERKRGQKHDILEPEAKVSLEPR